MKSTVKKLVICSTMMLGLSGNAIAQGFVENLTDFGSDLVGGPLKTGVDGANDGIRSVAGITTIKGKVETKVTAGDITQSIRGGEENLNDLNIGSVNGGAFIGGDFKSKVRVGNIKQTLSGNKNVNRANIGSVTN